MSRAARVVVTALLLFSFVAVPATASDAPYYFALARMYAAEGAVERAAKAFRKAIELEPADSYLRLEHAEFLSRRGLLRQAIREAELALDLDEENLEAVRLVGYLHLELAPGDSRSIRLARAAFERIREADPYDISSMLTLSRIYVRIGEAAKAFDVLEEAFVYAPDHPAVRSRLLEAASWSGDEERAETVLGKLLERDPTSLDASLAMARLLANRGEHEAAIDVLMNVPGNTDSDGQLEFLLSWELYREAIRRDISWRRRQERLARAADAVERLFEIQPANPEGRYLEALILSALNENEAAIERLVALRTAAPRSLQKRSMGKLAELLAHQGRTDEAAAILAELAEGLAASADDTEASDLTWMDLTRLHAQEKQWHAMAEVAMRLQASDDEGVALEGMLLGAEAELQQGRYGAALRLLEDSTLADDPRVAVKKAEVRFAADEEKLGMDLLAQVVRAGDIDGLLAVVQFHLERERHEEVLPVLRKSLKAVSSEEHAGLERELVLLLVDSLGEVERPEKALAVLADRQETFEKATSNEIQRYDIARAELLEAAGRTAESQALFAEIESDDDPSRVLATADRYQSTGRYGPMVPMLERAIATFGVNDSESPTKVDLLFALGMAHERLGQLEQSETAFRGVLELNPDDSRTLNYLGYTWTEQGTNLEEALVLIERAVALEPRNGAYLDSLGWAYYQLARYEEARHPLETAAVLVPDDPTILEHMGDLYLALADREKALRLYRRAMDAGVEDVEQLRAKLVLLEADDS